MIILCILAAIIWLIVRAVSRRQPAEKQVYKPRELPHVRAIRELEGLNNKKLWQNDKHKLYYTHLTDIVRTYLEGRYGIGAMEMTSDEIMSAIKDTGLNVKNIDDLGELLYSADLVKFAKHVPDAETNEKVWYDAFYFVEDTKEAPIEKGAALDDNADTGNYSDTPDEK